MGATQQLAATVRDQNNQPISGLTTTFASGDLGVATVSAGGLVTATGNGSTSITVSHGTISAQVAVSVSQVVTQLAKIGGDQQTGQAGNQLPLPVQVELQDSRGNPVPGTLPNTSVQFVVSNGGSVTSGVVAAGPNGRASTMWTLGATQGTQQLTATHQGGTASAQFTATAGSVGPYNVDVRFYGATAPTASQQAAFANAEARWEAIIAGDLANIPVNQPMGGACGSLDPDLPAINETVDDLLIFAKVESIDGPGNLLGRATPCLVRATGGLPVVGWMEFDTDDLEILETNGQLNLLILHEMGHVLGFGSLWDQAGFTLLSDACPAPSNCTTDPFFNGARAIGAFDSIGGSGYPGPKVPVEDCVTAPGPCGEGTINTHWREAELGTELMTGYLTIGVPNPLSVITIGSFWDQNYVVSYAAADAFNVPAPPSLRAADTEARMDLGNDVPRIPIRLVDGSGRVVRTWWP